LLNAEEVIVRPPPTGTRRHPLLLEDAEPFETLMARCADIAMRANRASA
jgi:hypothetical protein